MLQRQDFICGAVVCAVATVSFWLCSDLATSTSNGIGPGMAPKGLSVLLGSLGLMLLVNSLLTEGPSRTAVVVRSPVFVLGSLLVFGFTVRPLGLAVAGPLAIVVGALASDEVRWTEAIIAAIATTFFCIVLFKFALGLPIPLAPWLYGY